MYTVKCTDLKYCTRWVLVDVSTHIPTFQNKTQDSTITSVPLCPFPSHTFPTITVFDPHGKEVRQYTFLSVWLISLNIVFWRFNQLLYGEISFSGSSSPILWIYHPDLLNHSSDNEYLRISRVFVFIYILWKELLYTSLYTSFCGHLLSFLLHKYLEVERLGCEASVCWIL